MMIDRSCCPGSIRILSRRESMHRSICLQLWYILVGELIMFRLSRFGLSLGLLLLAACGGAASNNSLTSAGETPNGSATGTADSAPYATDNSSATAENGAAPIEEALPEFNLPAPRASARATLPLPLFGAPRTLGDIERRLVRELDRQHYVGRSYFSVPQGFALVTQVERIDSAGRPAASNMRWVTGPVGLLDPAHRFSLSAIVNALRNADPGRYRAIVFLVTTANRTTGESEAGFAQAEGWSGAGGDTLPANLRATRLTPNHHVTVLVYEFARSSVRATPRQVTPSAQDCRAHLRAAGLF